MNQQRSVVAIHVCFPSWAGSSGSWTSHSILNCFNFWAEDGVERLGMARFCSRPGLNERRSRLDLISNQAELFHVEHAVFHAIPCQNERDLNKNVACPSSWLAKHLRHGTLARKMSKVAREWRGLKFAKPQSGTLATSGCNLLAHQTTLEST